MATGYVKVCLPSVESTQDSAFDRFAGVPAVVVAERQTRGRGRTGATWIEPDRAIFVSLAFVPPGDPAGWAALPLIGGLAAVDALDHDGRSIRLKWPNDLVVGDDKVGGLLVEVRGDVVVAGWGCNLYWAEAPDGACALLPSDPGNGYAIERATAWAELLLAAATRGFDAAARLRYASLSATVGQSITWEPSGAGIAEAVAEDGGLVVRTSEGTAVLRSGAVRHVRAATMPPSETESM
ncbi:MAG: biotin--[acetyl-CoA-carboxylase] ligase [Acidimicrobiia bacterium]|nr:biotin--[acetyl-CoA-carboxylase] ligase [Acidimicrobiia bacterium]